MAYQNDPEAALIQFTSPEQAKRAMQSTEAVLNNRFIKVHWFREDMGDGAGQSRPQQLHPQPPSAIVRAPSQTVALLLLTVLSQTIKLNLRALDGFFDIIRDCLLWYAFTLVRFIFQNEVQIFRSDF